MLTTEIMYSALVNKDASFEGLFIAAVKTTGIFCLPVCTARKPKQENVEFFSTVKEAIMHGYRPCKICRPMQNSNEMPVHITDLLEKLQADPSIKFHDHDLRQNGIEPATLRRWFLKNHGMTFHAYQRLSRINSAFKKIQSGEKITYAAFDAGYNSLSGFNDSFKSVFGISPSNSSGKKPVLFKRIDTPLGTIAACATDKGICLLEFTERRMLETELKDISKIFNATIVQSGCEHFDLLEEELKNYFNGTLYKFTVPLSMHGTNFQLSTWNELLKIPYGKTISYKTLAANIGKPTAFRAVANANGMNRIAIIIPCHRVINENGNLCGYGGGVWRKKWLLQLESGKRELKLF
jgi:AraC family transcriptional regulator, regulatory protein of adaptative response / methylated-DNA-[protein]-cysteine methyltransferase